MGTLTIPDLPDDLLDGIRRSAEKHGLTVEDEVKGALERRYASSAEVLDDIRKSWERLPETPRDMMDAWIDEARRGGPHV